MTFHIKSRIFREVSYNIPGGRVDQHTSQKTNTGKDLLFSPFDGTIWKLILMCRHHLDLGLNKEKLSTATGRLYRTENLREKAILQHLFLEHSGLFVQDHKPLAISTQFNLLVAYYHEPSNLPFARVRRRPLPQCRVPQTRETAQTADDLGLCSQKSQVQILTVLLTASNMDQGLTCFSLGKMGITIIPTS